MHPDGVFVFLSLLIYGGLFSTQNKNLHFNFHYLYLPPQCSSPGRQLVLCSPSAAPHCTSIGEDMGAGAAQALLYRNKLTLLRSPVRYMPSKDPWHVWFHFSSLPPCCDGEGSRACVLPGSKHQLSLGHLFSKKQQPTKEELGYAQACLCRWLIPLPSPFLQGWQENEPQALPGGLLSALFPAGLSLFGQHELASRLLSKNHLEHSKCLGDRGWTGVQKLLSLLGFILSSPSNPSGHNKFPCQPRLCVPSHTLPLLVCAVWMGCHRQHEPSEPARGVGLEPATCGKPQGLNWRPHCPPHS